MGNLLPRATRDIADDAVYQALAVATRGIFQFRGLVVPVALAVGLDRDAPFVVQSALLGHVVVHT